MKDRDKALAMGMIMPTEKLCLECHNDQSPHYKGFNYSEYLVQISHPIPPAE
ncbi:MAG: hypothetical protein ISR56_04095 [Bacteroidales bacterium]|nr:hypothetical protein [Bacteroidales bacterium]